MKSWMLLLVSGFLLIACAGVAALEHRISYSRKGTRSEAQHGYLYVNNAALPDVFEYVQQDNQAWAFFKRHALWGNDGYHATEAKPAPVAKESIATEDLSRGWYCNFGRLGGTPSDWLNVRWGTNNAFVAPASIGDLVAARTPPQLPRDRRLEQLMRD